MNSGNEAPSGMDQDSPHVQVHRLPRRAWEKICPLKAPSVPGIRPGNCVGRYCALFRGEHDTGLCAISDIAGYLGNHQRIMEQAHGITL